MCCSRGKKVQALIILFVIVSITVLNSKVAKVKAYGELVRLDQSDLSIMQGGSYELTVENSVYSWSDITGVYWYSSNPTVANVDQQGIVTAYEQGTTVITYIEEITTSDGSIFSLSAYCNVTVIPANYTIDIHEKELLKGDTFSITIPNGVKYSYTTQSDDYYDCIYVVKDEVTGKLNITALVPGEVTLVINFLDIYGSVIASDSCKITIMDKGINPESMVCAVGVTKQIIVNGYTKEQIISFVSMDPTIATIDASGIVTAKKIGETQITLTVRESNGMIVTYTCYVVVSDPKLNKTSSNLAIGCNQQIDFSGTQPNSEIILKSSKQSVVSVDSYGNTIYAIKKGTSTITCTVDGKQLKYKVTVTDPKVKVRLIPLVKGKTSQLKVYGTNSKSVITYQSTSNSIAQVSKKGKIVAKKNGSACIQINVDGKELRVPVSVSNTKIVNMMKYALKAIGKPYSQAKRMQKGYYDCSSLTWRSYHSAGVNIGNKYWAPTAADMAHTLVKSKKAIAYKELPISKLKPGDLIFFTKTDGTNNGRYKNIYHVAIYVGSYGNDSGVGLLMEARLDGINLFDYYSDSRKVAVIARPMK